MKRFVTPESLQKQDAPQPAQHFTEKQGQYQAFIYYYTATNGRPPSEADIKRFFRVTPPSVHDMVLRLKQDGGIERTPGHARSIPVLVSPAELPVLEAYPGQ